MINDLKELERLLKLCRKQGVTEIALPQVSFKLGEMPVRHPTQSIEDQTENSDYDDIESMGPDELIRYSNGVLLSEN